MKPLLLLFYVFLLGSTAYASSPMKIEGSCKGTLINGTQVSYKYFSNFDGCKKISQASVSFTSGLQGRFKGKRSFTETQDIYDMKGGYKLIFNNSTGNTSGTLLYPKNQSVTTQCEVRDYEYSDC
jgi:hypothetical protein